MKEVDFMKKITIIVPCYNEQDSLRLFYDEILKYMKNPNYMFELLFINDGSKDKTIDIIRELSAMDKRVGYISFSRNFGKEAAMQAGLEKCKNNDAVIMIDADLQHPPYLIDDMIKYWEEGYSLVYAKNRSRKGEPKLKVFCAKMFYRLFARFSNIQLEQSVKDFQLLDNKVINAYLSIKDNNRFVKGMFSWVGFNKKCLLYDYVDRQAGATTWNFKKLFKYAFDGINQYSHFLMILPILGMTLIGVVSIIDIVLYVLTLCDVAYYMDLSFFLQQMQLNLYTFLIFLMMYFMFYLMYNIRTEVLKRPIYLVEEESDSLVRVSEDNIHE